ncbi:MAG: N-acetylmuramoyl-L-alanine amidase [Acidimicrobiia bacterium]
MAYSTRLSPNRTTGRSGEILWVVIHSMEVDYRPGIASAVASYFSRSSSAVSSHVCIDGADVITCVEDGDTAWAAARTGNRHGLHVELAGRAADARDVWLSRSPMLGLAAEWIAERATKHGIPIVFQSAAGLRAGARGITTHREITDAFGETDHTDPGSGFPMDQLMAQVVARLGGGIPQSPPTWSGRVLRLANPMMTGSDVEALQRRLAELGFAPGPIDGIFGGMTLAAVNAFQSARFGRANGMVGAFTWTALFAQERGHGGPGSLEDDERAALRDEREVPHPAHDGHNVEGTAAVQ